MSDRSKSILAISLSVAALAVVVIGLAASPGTEPTDDERVEALAATIRCPFCNGESLAESSASVAADYRALIAERVAAGRSDAEIRQEFADNFGEAFLLDTPDDGWSIALWLVPIAVLLIGVVVILSLRRRADTSEGVSVE